MLPTGLLRLVLKEQGQAPGNPFLLKTSLVKTKGRRLFIYLLVYNIFFVVAIFASVGTNGEIY